MFRVTWPQRKKLIQHIFRQIVLIQHILFSPYFVRKRERPQIRVRMQANDDNENEDGAVEGLVDLGEANLYQGAPILFKP